MTYFTILLFSARKLCSSQPEVGIEAVELVNLLLAKIHRKPEVFEKGYKEAGIKYLMKSLRNLFLEKIKKQKKNKEKFDKYSSNVQLESSVSPDADLTPPTETPFPAEYLPKLKKYLKPKQYKVFVLHIQGYKYKQIAKELELKVSDVGTTLNRAKKRLRGLLETIEKARDELFGNQPMSD
ncbi:MAG: sigma factor-like helix-turn-helix DNA-binding protein [Bacteroidota bacterium]